MLVKVKTYLNEAWVNPEAIDAIDFFQRDEAFIVTGNISIKVTHNEANRLIGLINGDTKPTAQNIQVHSIVDFHRATAHSKSTNSDFDMWRCNFGGNKPVNIFDHPDASRNTFDILRKRGWEEYFKETIQDAQVEPIMPISCTLSFDGEWYTLIDIMEYQQHKILVDLHYGHLPYIEEEEEETINQPESENDNGDQ